MRPPAHMHFGIPIFFCQAQALVVRLGCQRLNALKEMLQYLRMLRNFAMHVRLPIAFMLQIAVALQLMQLHL